MRANLPDEHDFMTIYQGGHELDDSYPNMGYPVVYADNARLYTKEHLLYNVNLNKLRYFTCSIIVMSGNITMHDIDVILQQMEAMTLRVLLLQDFNENFNQHFETLRVPILKYSTKNDSNKVSAKNQ